MADLIPFPRLGERRPRSAQFIAEFIHELAELSEPCRATSEYLNRPCRSPAELEAMLRAQSDTTAARESV